MDAKIRLLEDERNIVSAYLFARAAAEPGVSGDDTFAHLAAEPFRGEQAIEGGCGFGAGFVVDEAMQVEVVADVAPRGHGNGSMLEVLGQAQKLGTVAPGNKPGKGLAELVRAEPPGFPIMIGDADMPRKVIDAPGDMHVRLFVAVLGGSSLSFACATWTEQFADWAEAHNAAFAFFGGVPQLLVPDNAKVAVIKACHFDPMLNRSYTDMARHYGTAVLPARPRRPKDKAKVEACVRIVERWVLGRLRNRIFYSLAELNAAIADCLADLNERRVLRQFGRTRRQLFEEVDAPNLKPLPAEPWVHAQWKRCRVGLDYHIALEQHHYSVPHRYARREVEVRYTARSVEIFLGGERIAVHMRGSGNGRHTTVPEHMPSSHRRYLDWTPAKIQEEAGRIGPMLSMLMERIIEDRPHPEQGYRSCLGIIGLSKRFGPERLEAAALRALEIGARNYPSVKSILEKGLDKVPVSKAPEREPILHDNIRGSQYYH